METTSRPGHVFFNAHEERMYLIQSLPIDGLSQRLSTLTNAKPLVTRPTQQFGLGYAINTGRPGGVSGYPRAWYRSVSRVRAPPSAYSINSLGLSLVHKLTCGKRKSVSWQHSMKNRRPVGLLNPMRDKN